MTKKNLKPQQAAPVQRENTTATVGAKGITAVSWSVWLTGESVPGLPFAGDDAE
ncbi:anacyclamide/piricyclamide family prenylated cyclic peptide [Planktothrix sp. PCC 11201]|uniref:anacyclamide/piricyclamide family prenylated cyclic peptide n=1 Tax=Planktothrix sp. PCC 11201 TaxID=1729650 RepID=UPI0009A6CA72|nr:anacyclamide/piricyclamide family prenylated cyclic peptide [Planktothrix sp. PCC 11201]